jgi:hypothetical protein
MSPITVREGFLKLNGMAVRAPIVDMDCCLLADPPIGPDGPHWFMLDSFLVPWSPPVKPHSGLTKFMLEDLLNRANQDGHGGRLLVDVAGRLVRQFATRSHPDKPDLVLIEMRV